MTAPFDILIPRALDPKGHGDYGMPRGTKKHRGWDVVEKPGAILKAPIGGVISKFGYMYDFALQFRYIEITDQTYRFRLGYAELFEDLKVGQHILEADCVGKLQNIAGYWGGEMKNHLHIECYKNGLLTDPEPLFKNYIK